MSKLIKPRMNRISPTESLNRQQANMASTEDLFTSSSNLYEMTQPLPRTSLECIKEDDGQSHDVPELFIISNQEKKRGPSPVSSDCRWNLPDDDSELCHDDKHLYRRLCCLISIVCLVSICAFILTVLMLLGFVNGSNTRRCSCPANQVKAQSELQRRVQEIDNMDKNVSHLTNMMKIQKTDVQRIWILLNMTMEKLQKNNVQRPTTTSEVVTPTNTPLVNPKDSELSRLRALYNETLNELNQLKLKVSNITLTPGPTGPQGQEGLIGPRGYNGTIGPPGNPGKTGPSGPTGPRGLNGTRGLPGPQGQQGLTGPQGLTGLQGPPGAHGNNGSSGPTGPRGNAGTTGPQGLQGVKGPPGLQGPPGLPGSRGAGNFSLCVYKRKDSTGVGSGPSAATQVFLTEPTNRRIIGAVCSSNNAEAFILTTVIRPDNGRRVYKCECQGQSKFFGGSDPRMFCYVNYWECPLSS